MARQTIDTLLDDATAECAVAAMTAAERAELEALADDWDARVEAMEDAENWRKLRGALLICAPVVFVSLVVLALAWGW